MSDTTPSDYGGKFKVSAFSVFQDVGAALSRYIKISEKKRQIVVSYSRASQK